MPADDRHPRDRRAAGPDGQLLLLGPVECVIDRQPAPLGGRRQRSIAAVLALHHGRTLAVSSLIDAVWGSDPPVNVLKSLSTQVARLRRALGGAGVTLEHTGTGYRMDLPGAWLDVDRFEQGLTDAAELRAAGEPDAALAAIEEALGLWRGEPMHDLDDVPFVPATATALCHRRHEAEDELVELLLELGRAHDAAARLEAMVRELPYAEGRWEQLVAALVAAGRRRDALQAYQRARRELEEVGMVPGRRLRRAELVALRPDSPTLPPATRPDVLATDELGHLSRHPVPSSSQRFDAAVVTAEVLAARAAFDTAVDVLTVAVEEAPDEEAAVAARIRLAAAQSAAGRGRDAAVLLDESDATARQLDRWDLVADASVTRAHVAVTTSTPDALRRADAAAEVLDHLADDDVERRVRLLCWSADLVVNIDAARTETLLAAAERLAGTTGRPDLELVVARGRLRQREARGDDPMACARDARALAGRAARYGAPAVAAFAHVAGRAALLRAGDYPGCQRTAAAVEATARSLHQPIAVAESHTIDVALALATGPLVDGDARSDELLAEAMEQGLDAGLSMRALQLVTIRREQERLHELEQAVQAFAAHGRRPILHGVMAAARLERSDAAGAFDALGPLLAGSPAEWNRDWLRVATLALLADVLHDLAACDVPIDGALVDELRQALEPVEDQTVVVCSYVVVLGRVHRYLGRLAMVAGDLDEAVRRCGLARELDGSTGSDLWAGWAGCDEAEARLRRNRPGDGDRAAALLLDATSRAEAVGSRRLARAAGVLGSRRSANS